jgi:hypothetical protein
MNIAMITGNFFKIEGFLLEAFRSMASFYSKLSKCDNFGLYRLLL